MQTSMLKAVVKNDQINFGVRLEQLGSAGESVGLLHVGHPRKAPRQELKFVISLRPPLVATAQQAWLPPLA